MLYVKLTPGAQRAEIAIEIKEERRQAGMARLHSARQERCRDLTGWIVSAGWAIAYTGYGILYREEEAAASHDHLGNLAGTIPNHRMFLAPGTEIMLEWRWMVRGYGVLIYSSQLGELHAQA
jgi:hypothetical protein